MRALRRLLLKGRRAFDESRDAVRAGMRRADGPATLDSVQRRIEIVLAATYGRPIPITPIVEEQPASRIRRALVAVERRLRVPREPVAESDGQTVRLPPELPRRFAPEGALAHYRLMALEQAERLARGTHAFVPDEDPLTRDLYLLRESAVVDGAIARANGGLAGALEAARQRALAGRAEVAGLSPLEQRVERITREELARPLRADDQPEPGNAPRESPADSLWWAQQQASALRAEASRAGEGVVTYRGITPVGLWGTVHRARAVVIPDDAKAKLAEHGTPNALPIPVGDAGKASPQSENATRLSASTEKDTERPEAPSPTVPMPGNADDSASQEVLLDVADGDPESVDLSVPGIAYPEWDYAAARYVPNGALVRAGFAPEGDERWALDHLAARASLVRRVQQQFERLRARRARLHQQDRGDELDLEACVRAIVDKRTGASPSERLYVDTRPARRGLAISLLVDTSGSTDTQVTAALQIIDVEKIAVLLATAAFDALGDAYNVLTFTGRGAQEVRVTTVKGFTERSGPAVRRRVSALQPESGTRLGAAVRHATAELLRQPAGHRLLLIVSDGRPNDVGYMDTYAVEDSRQAILEARGAGVFPFCLTVDRDGAEYLPHVFGSAGHVIIRDPEGLPGALLRAVRQLLRYA